MTNQTESRYVRNPDPAERDVPRRPRVPAHPRLTATRVRDLAADDGDDGAAGHASLAASAHR